MTRFQRFGMLTLCAVIAGSMLLPGMLNGAAPRTPAATSPAGGRSLEAIVAEMRATDAQVREVMPSILALTDPAYRAADGQKAIAPMKKMAALFAELEKVAPVDELKDTARMNRFRVNAYAAALGDKESRTLLDDAAKGTGADALSAKTSLLMVEWLNGGKDAAVQGKLIDSAAVLAKANPTSDEMLETLNFMANVNATDETSKKVIDVIRGNLKGPQVEQMLASIDAEQKQKELVGKPFAIEGRTSSDGKFSTDSLKGKVVLIDFWATWCGPCIAELPNVKKTYSDLHEKGFEIVGVSCDANDKVLNDFVKENNMSWVQLREVSQSERDNWHPLAKRYGVMGIPQMFLIDRKGVLRHVDAREDLATKVKALLDEGAPATQPAK